MAEDFFKEKLANPDRESKFSKFIKRYTTAIKDAFTSVYKKLKSTVESKPDILAQLDASSASKGVAKEIRTAIEEQAEKAIQESPQLQALKSRVIDKLKTYFESQASYELAKSKNEISFKKTGHPIYTPSDIKSLETNFHKAKEVYYFAKAEAERLRQEEEALQKPILKEDDVEGHFNEVVEDTEESAEVIYDFVHQAQELKTGSNIKKVSKSDGPPLVSGIAALLNVPMKFKIFIDEAKQSINAFSVNKQAKLLGKEIDNLPAESQDRELRALAKMIERHQHRFEHVASATLKSLDLAASVTAVVGLALEVLTIGASPPAAAGVGATAGFVALGLTASEKTGAAGLSLYKYAKAVKNDHDQQKWLDVFRDASSDHPDKSKNYLNEKKLLVQEIKSRNDLPPEYDFNKPEIQDILDYMLRSKSTERLIKLNTDFALNVLFAKLKEESSSSGPAHQMLLNLNVLNESQLQKLLNPSIVDEKEAIEILKKVLTIEI